MAARSVGTRRSAWLRTLAYAFSPVLLFAVFFDIHASVLATPLLLLLFEGVDQDRSRQLVLAGTAAALLREDIAFFVLALAVLFYKENPRAMRALVAVSAVTLVVGRAVAAGGDSSVMPPHLNFSYAYVDLMDPFGTLDGAVGALFVAGADSLLLVLAAIVLPWIGYGRLDGRVLVFGALTAAPFLFSDYAVTKSVDSHYYFALAPILFWASIRGRRDDLEPSVSSRSLLPVLALAFALIGGPLVTGLLARDSLTAVEIVDRAASNSDRYRSTQEVLACLPGDYSVAVGPELVPHVARHATVWQWPQPVDSAVWILGGNRFVMQPVDRDGIPDAVVFSTSSYDPADLGLERVEADPASGLSVFVTSGPAAGAVRSCLQSG